jgi:hypothetical protein
MRSLLIALEIKELITFISILDEIVKIEEVVNSNENFTAIIDVLRDVTGKLFGFRCKS